MHPFDRRTFLLGSAGAGAAALLAACGDDGGGDSTASEGGSGEVAFLVPTFPDGFRAESVVVAGIPQRISFVLRDDVDTMRANAPAEIRLRLTDASGGEISSATVPVHDDGIITPYYPLTFTVDAPGEYQVAYVDDIEVAGVPFVVRDRAEVSLVQVGDPLRPVDTPTFDDPAGVDPICTRATPCDFHGMTLTDAIASDRSTVLIVSTPGFCQTDICGPVLDLLIEATDARDDLDIVHAEVYVDPNNAPTEQGGFGETTEVVEAYDLPFEPQLLVADASGTVTARIDTTWDRAELADALATV